MPPIFDRTLMQGRAEASYRLFDGGAGGARIEVARSASDVAGVEARSAREDVLAGVTIAYARGAAASIRHEAASQREAAGVEGKRQADRLFAEGVVAEVETVRAEAERLAGVAAVATAVSFEPVARQDLARWMGVEPAAIAERPLRPMEVDAEATRGDTLPSADVERAAHRLRQARAGVDVERAGRLPRLDAQAALLEFGSGEGSFQGEWQAGIALSFPAFTGGARGAAIDRARATARGAEAELEVARLRQASAIDRERASLVAAIANGAALRERSEALFEVMNIAFLAYDEGAGTQRERNDASADAYEARAALADAVAEQVRAAVELGRARGVLTPGWISRTLKPAP
jgi:cobalt-zinc-cadmium efflux system outer membrane protein